MSSIVIKSNYFPFGVNRITVKRSPCAIGFLQFLLFMMLFFSGNSVATDSITRSSGISIGQTLISSGQIFELGFFNPINSAKRYVGIWYRSILNPRPVWVANRDSPLTIADNGSSLAIGDDGNLRIWDGERNTVWSTNVSSLPNGTVAVLSDQGKLILKDRVTGSILWDSFNYPADTFIAGMRLSANKKTGERCFLSSWKADDDPSYGYFTYGITTEMPPQTFVWKNSKPYRRSGPWDGWKFIGSYYTQVEQSNGAIVTQDIQQGTTSLTYIPRSKSDALLILLTPDRNVRMSQWDIDTSQGGVTWVAQQVPLCEIYATCGPFGFCDRIKTRTCHCLNGYVPKSIEEWSKQNWTDGCVRQTELLCERNISTSPSSKAKSDRFWKLSDMKVPDHYLYLYNLDDSGCQQQCLSNCSCVAYAYPQGIGCMIWVGDLLDAQQFSGSGADLFIRVADSELGVGKYEHNKKKELVIILTTVAGAIFLVAVILVLYKCTANRKAMRSCQINQVDLADQDIPKHHMTKMESSELPMFEFSTLAVATNNFSETNKLGAGGFGPVYRGKLEDGQEIAVKRLAIHSGQGAIEFKNEILLISKLQHRNLVRLIGYCIEGDEKLLIYEHLKNKSLDTFLFDTSKRLQLDWRKRFNIIEGIARGLLYLHRDSCLRIIHRDLKAGNILLDDNMNPKVSDFGTARAFQITQELTNTHRVVGTHGYLSPEYAVGGTFSEKSDIFSFGVLLLEILSGIKVRSFICEEKYDLLGHAWNLWNEGSGLTLMDKEMPNSCSETEFTKCLQIGLLCVQDYAAERPTMSAVVLMLTSDVNIPQPSQPTFYHSLLNPNFQRQHVKFSTMSSGMELMDSGDQMTTATAINTSTGKQLNVKEGYSCVLPKEKPE